MRDTLQKIALGGGCHWCTEAVFQVLKGVERVEQGFVAPLEETSAFSEAVIVHFNPAVIPLARLIEIHLYTHSSTSGHSMRFKYRSAVYAFNEIQESQARKILKELQENFEQPLVTQVYSFGRYKSSLDQFQDYYKKDPSRPFCETYIAPKLKKLLRDFSEDIRSGSV